MVEKTWQFWIDVGGTFTDIVAIDSKQHLHTHKLLSQQPQRYGAVASQEFFEG